MGANYGVTPGGFIVKRLVDIQAETAAEFRARFGQSINLDGRAPFGLIKAIFDEREAKIWEAIEELYYAMYPDTSEGVTLDNVASITGATRKEATYSEIASGTARGTLNTVIPAGTIISVSGNATARFVTIVPVTIDVAAVNEVQKINFTHASPTAGDFKITFVDETTVAIPFNAAAIDVANALNGLLGLSGVTVSGSYASGWTITFAGDDGGKNQPTVGIADNTLMNSSDPLVASVVVLTQGDTPKAENISLVAESPGIVAAPSGSLTVIETPISGLDSFTNELDADVGTDRESDAAFRARRRAEVSLSGKATLDAIRSQILSLSEVTAAVVFQNNTNVVDIEGRPPHSVDIVVQGGDNQTIADLIFDVVAGGITTVGEDTYTVIDSQGGSQTIKFSRPDVLPIYLDVKLTTDSNLFPPDGFDQAETALLAYGNSLGMGDDVIVFPKLVAALNNIPGILDVEIKIGTAPSPTLDNNIVVSSRQVSEFDSSRTLVHS